MKIKEYIAKLKERITVLPQYLKNNKRLTILLCILVILLSVASIIYSVQRGKTPAAALPGKGAVAPAPAGEGDAAAEGEAIEVLPQEERVDEGYRTSPDPFAAPPQLVGLILDSAGDDYAIIEIGGRAYIKTEDEIIADLWKVEMISRDKVVIVSGDDELILFLSR